MFSFLLYLLINILFIKYLIKLYLDINKFRKERKNWFIDQNSDSENEYDDNYEDLNYNKLNHNKKITNELIIDKLDNIDKQLKKNQIIIENIYEKYNKIFDKIKNLDDSNNNLEIQLNKNNLILSNIKSFCNKQNIIETFPKLYKVIKTMLNKEIIKPTNELTNIFKNYDDEFNTILFEMYLYSEYAYLSVDSEIDYKDKYDIINNNIEKCNIYYESKFIYKNDPDLEEETKKFYFKYRKFDKS